MFPSSTEQTPLRSHLTHIERDACQLDSLVVNKLRNFADHCSEERLLLIPNLAREFWDLYSRFCKLEHAELKKVRQKMPMETFLYLEETPKIIGNSVLFDDCVQVLRLDFEEELARVLQAEEENQVVQPVVEYCRIAARTMHEWYDYFKYEKMKSHVPYDFHFYTGDPRADLAAYDREEKRAFYSWCHQNGLPEKMYTITDHPQWKTLAQGVDPSAFPLQ